jgi:hypothetical protein
MITSVLALWANDTVQSSPTSHPNPWTEQHETPTVSSSVLLKNAPHGLSAQVLMRDSTAHSSMRHVPMDIFHALKPP